MDIPPIKEEDRKHFLEILRQIYKWFEIIYDRDGYEALWLLLHTILYLDKLNADSFYYNVLTAEWLMTDLKRTKSVINKERK